MKKRIVSLFMALVMTLSLLPTTAWAVQPSPATTEQTLTEKTAEEPSAAEETTPAEVQPAAESADTELTDANSFLLFAATNVEVLIAPERVPYQPGQTVREALLALQNREETPHTFDGLETVNGFVTAIDGVSANYSRSDDKGSFDLEQRADSVGAFLFLTAYDTLNEETASALCALGRAMLAWQEAEKPQMQKFARQEYDAAAKALTAKKTADELTALSTALTERMEAYTQYENAETKPLNVRFLGLTGQLLTDYTFTAADPYGNEKTFTNEHPALAAGSYTFTLTSGLNGASGVMTVAEDGGVTVADETLTTLRVPQGVAWMAQPVLRSVNGGDAAENRYPMEQNGTVALVPDTVGPTGGLYLYGVPGADLESKTYQWNGSKVTLCAMYTDVNGKKVDKSRSWESTHQALADVAGGNAQREDAAQRNHGIRQIAHGLGAFLNAGDVHVHQIPRERAGLNGGIRRHHNADDNGNELPQIVFKNDFHQALEDVSLPLDGHAGHRSASAARTSHHCASPPFIWSGLSKSPPPDVCVS